MASSGNFCTLNPLDCDDAGDLINGNLTLSHTDSAWRTAFGNMGVSSGKWYFESRQVNSASGNGYAIAVQRMSEGLNYKSWTAQGVGGSVGTYGYGYAFYTKGSGDASEKVHNNSYVTTSDITAGVAGDVYQIALDLDNNKVWFGKNNTWHNSGDPANNSNETYSSLPAGTYCSAVCIYTTSSDYFTHNYGQDSTFGGVATAGGNADGNGFGDFAYAPPTGFLAMCTGNLPISNDIDPAQTDDDYPQKQFNAVAYTGTGSARTVSGFGFQPDMVWIKNRASPGDQAHRIVDSSRGVSKAMIPEDTQVENTETTAIQAFNSDGFTIGSALGGYNTSSATYIVWGWKANGGTTVSNSSGSITSTVQANTKAGFSIVTYAGNDGSWGSGNRDTFGHGLSEAPEYIIIKERNATDAWTVFHAHVGNGGGSNAAANNLRLDTNDALYTNQSYKSFGETMPTSTLVTVEGNTTNSSGSNHIAYCWHSVEGYSKFGSYEGNGNDDGPFIYLGFRPRYWFFKEIDAADDWVAYDTARSTFNPTQKVLRYDVSSAEFDGSGRAVDVLSNGLKIRTSNGTINTNGNTYVFGAWGDVPFKYNNTF